jgi:cation transport ATPase
VYKIRRKGYELEAKVKDVEQGDIVLVEEGEVIKFDGIVLQVIRPMKESG